MLRPKADVKLWCHFFKTLLRPQSLKQLQSRKVRLEVDLNELSKDLKTLNDKHRKTANQLSSVRKEIGQLQDTDVIVSEHAILRYLERSKGLDMELVKNEILSESTKLLIYKMGNGKYPIGHGLKACVKNNTIVSIV